MTPMPAAPGRFAWFRRAAVVFRKELLDHTRDRRSLLLALIYPLLGPILLGVVLDFSIGSVGGGQQAAPRNFELAVSGGENALALVSFLESNGVKVKDPPADPEAAVRRGHEPIILNIQPSEDGAERTRIQVMLNLARIANSWKINRVMALVGQYGAEVTDQRIAAHGLDPQLFRPIEIEQVNLGRSADIALLLYNMIPPVVLFMVLMGAVYIAIDTTAGERERGSLEPLLTAPIERWELLLGKAASAYVFTMITVVINLAAFRAILGIVTAPHSHVTDPPSVAVFLIMFLIAMPLMAFAVTMQVSIAAITRSMKEAQIYLGLLPVVPVLPGIAMTLSPITPSLGLASIPIYGQLMIFSKLIEGELPAVSHVFAASITTLLVAFFFFRWSTRLFQREKLFLVG